MAARWPGRQYVTRSGHFSGDFPDGQYNGPDLAEFDRNISGLSLAGGAHRIATNRAVETTPNRA